MLKFQQKIKNMKNYYKVLKNCPLFKGIMEEDLSKLLNCLGAKVIEFDKKYTIIAEESLSKQVGVMLLGSANINKTDYYGNRSILSNVKEGEIFGEAFACAEVPSAVSVIAEEYCKVLFIESSRILRSCSNGCLFHQKLIYNLMQDIALKNVAFHQKMQITSKRTTREKLLAYLNFCARQKGSNYFEIPFDRQELADYLQVDRSGLSVEIGKLKNEGLIENFKNRFRLLK